MPNPFRRAAAGPGGVQEAANRVMLSSGNFQAQQVGIGDLHELVQNQAVRGPLEEANFRVHMENLTRLIELAGGQVQATQAMHQALEQRLDQLNWNVNGQ